ncbi:phage tail tape measure protein [Brevibacillus sp. H7]|uniref:phage tail tape measure protein n=1 Tax=Brevibacillus sp. H7 TaxID=3349138 RepID=UPI0037FA0848
MARKVYEIAFNIAGRLARTFTGSFASASSQLRTLGNDAKSLKGGLRTLEEEYKKGVISAQAYQAAHQRMTEQLEKTLQVQQRLAQVTQRQNELQQHASQIRGQVLDTAVMATPFIASARAAMQFETAMLGVAKQAEGARDEAGNLTSVYYQMRKEIQMLGRELPIANYELAKMVESGLRMNVPRDRVIQFTRETAKMATAFEMPADEIGDQMGKIANVMQIPIEKIGDLGDTINYLDDNSVSKGKDIIGVLLRTGGVLKQVNMDAGQGSALASTFLSLGKSEEVAATATNALIRELAIAEQQPQRFQDALKKLGLSAKQINKGMVKDAQGTILKVLDAINKLPKERQAEVTTGLFGKEYGDDIAALSGAVNEYRRQIALLNDAKRKGSMNREFNARMRTSEAQLQLMKNSASEAAFALGNILLPGLNEVFGGASKVAQAAAAFAEKYPTATKAIVIGTTALIGARIAWLGLKFAWTQAALMGNEVTRLFVRQAAAQTTATTATTLAAAATQRMTIAQRLLNLTMLANPIGLVIAGVVALGAAAYVLYKNWDSASQWFGDSMVKISNIFKSGANNIIQATNRIIEGINKLTGTSLPMLQEFQLDYSVQVRQMNERKLARNYGVDGSHANGLSYVPFNGYVAELHKGERVLTAQENREYSEGFWKTAGQSMGSSGGTVIQLHYNPVIHGVSKEEIEPVLQSNNASLMDQLKAIQHQGRRVAYA